MHLRQPLPRLWLMTDERQGKALWDAIDRLPRGAGIVFRHYSLSPGDRRDLFELMKRRAKRRGLTLLFAGSSNGAGWANGDGVHNAARAPLRRGKIRSASAHDMRELRAAERAGADLLFLSPAFPTRSHPGRRALGPLRFMLLARQARVPVIALGGMNARRAQRLGGGIHGWAGIDALTA